MSSLAEDFLEDGEDLGAAAHPLFEAFDAVADEAALFGVLDGAGGGGKLADAGFSAVEMGADLFADEAADESFEFDGGFVIGSAFDGAVGGGFADSAEAFEHAETLAGGALADTEAVNEVVERKRRAGDEQQAVDFADRAGESKNADSVDEEFHDLEFQRIEPCFRNSGLRTVHGSGF